MAENHHYVPVTYIKWFTNSNNKVWKKNVRTEYVASIKEFTPNQIGYETDFYKSINLIYNPDLDQDPYYVENIVNPKFENSINELITKFSSNAFVPTFPDRVRFAELILHLKRRNPHFRNTTFSEFNMAESKEASAAKAVDRADVDTLEDARRRGYSRESLVQLGVIIIDELSKSPEYRKEMHVNSLAIRKSDDPVLKEAVQLIATSDWEILNTPPNLDFISTDNPGFVKNQFGGIENMGFFNRFVFYFPLRADKMLVVRRVNTTYNMMVNIRQASAREVQIINNDMAKLAFRFIFGKSKTTLQHIVCPITAI